MAGTRALTEKEVAAAKAKPGQRLELWDAKSPGLCLRVTDRGVKTWVVRYRVGDRQPRMTLGRYPDMQLREARDGAADIRRAARNGDDPAAAKREKASKAKAEPIKTVDDLAQAYFSAVEGGRWTATQRGKKAGTITAERRLWGNRLKPIIGSRRVDDFKRRDGVAAIETIAEKAPVQSNRARALLGVMFRFAVERERIPANPMAGVKKIGRETTRHRTLSDAEIRRTWAGLLDPSKLKRDNGKGEREPIHVSAATATALRLSFVTLQRRSEIATMRVADLRISEAAWVQPDPKGGEPHLVPLSPLAVELIEAALALRPDAESPYVFPSPWKRLAQPIDPGAMTHALGDIYAALNIEGATLHDVRRTGASIMASERLGVQPIVISKVLGHKLDGGGGASVTARHYNLHAYAQEKRAALNAWATLLQSIVSGQALPSNVTPLRA